MGRSKVITDVTTMSEAARDWSFDPDTILIPTMGALHAGHLALVKSARHCASQVIVSIFVNPLQFGPTEDFEKYPRDLDRDIQLLGDAGCDIVFTPLPGDMTPLDMQFVIDPGPLANRLCGQFRPGHFKGVATIVTKLLQVVRPGRALFGWKDAQQYLLLKKMVHDLNIPVSMEAAETVREADGLAMSSRNSYLSQRERRAAPAIYAALTKSKNAYIGGVAEANTLIDLVKLELSREPALKLQYAELASMDDLAPLDRVVPGNTLLAVAAFAGQTRLIDNVRL